MYNDIISLQETSENTWQAKYQGNYGFHKIKIKLTNGKVDDFSCSCPSDYSPCKHIGMIKEAIDHRVIKMTKSPKEETISVEKLLQQVPHKELVNFIVQQAKYNPELTKKLFLEFLHKTTEKKENNYATLLRSAFEDLELDDDEYYGYQEDAIEIEILDELFEKASEFISQKRFDEAITICKACIEEYAQWLEELDTDMVDYLDPNYSERPFELLSEIAFQPGVNAHDLFQYCMSEMDKPNYSDSGLDDNFHDLLAELAQTDEDKMAFISLQNRLLKNIGNKNSNEAEEVIARIIAFFRMNNQEEKAWQLVEGNIQFESFRKQVVQQKITDGKLGEAKKLIDDFLFTHPNTPFRFHANWHELALSIAQHENDVPVIRKITFSFIENYFEAAHYRIFKSSFTLDEWKWEVKKIIAHYEKTDKGFSNSVANVLAEEQDAAMLIKYIEKHLTIDRLETYHSHFSKIYPNETLDLFCKVMNQYAEQNTGRTHYEFMVRIFKKMALVKGGKEMANRLIAQYKIQYKSRRAMVEVFNQVHF